MSEPCHALVFRNVREQLCLRKASDAVRNDLAAFQETQNKDFLVSALLRAGEMECALADTVDEAGVVFTDVLSSALVDPASANACAERAQHSLEKLPYKSTLDVSRPEGFAFYGLHPMDYADAVGKMDLSGDGLIVVIGIRTIGLTLGEVVTASLHARFGDTRKTRAVTVRPSGHPYDRRCSFTEPHINVIAEDAKNARVIVVDEGPGLSGSSFLSVGEALVALGVAPSQITFLCSRDVDPAGLVTSNGAERWSRFKTHVVKRNHFKPEGDAICAPAGDWRKRWRDDEREWPGLWTAMLPPTYRSADGEHTFEYHGLGRYGAELRERMNRNADSGFSPEVVPAANGFSRSGSVKGRRLTKADLSQTLLDRMATYLALRTQCFAVEPHMFVPEFENMVRFNFEQATARQLPEDLSFPVQRAVISDSQMMPYQWLQPDDGGEMLKLDCAAHGDNHFFPGPVEAAWDVAGAIIEWEMDEQNSEYLLRRYEQLTGDDVRTRLNAYMVAYLAFRNGYCRMAASAMADDPGEQGRLLRDARKYFGVLEKLVPAERLTAAAYE